MNKPYVAPFNLSLEDERIYEFLDTIGSKECREKIKNLQLFVLKHEDEALEKVKWYSWGAHHTYSYLNNSMEKAFELAVLEFPFSFWQWGGKCEEIPATNSLDTCLKYLLKISDIGFFADKSMKLLAPHYYQAASQMGYYGYNILPLKPYIKHFTKNPLAAFYPKNAGVIKYDNSLNVSLHYTPYCGVN